MARARRSGKKIDFVHWHGAVPTSQARAAGTTGVQVAAALSTHPETLLRIRGNVLCYADATQAPGGLIDIGLGLIVVPGGTGTTVTQAPITDADAPWLWYDRFAIGYEEYVTDVIDLPVAAAYRSVIDNKAMRILRLDEEIQFVVENATLGAAMSVNVVASMRLLFGT